MYVFGGKVAGGERATLLGRESHELAGGRRPEAISFFILNSVRSGALPPCRREFLSRSGDLRLFLWSSVLTLLVPALSGALIPEPEVKIEVLQKPFICHRQTKGGDLMLVHYEGYLEKDGSLFHST